MDIVFLAFFMDKKTSEIELVEKLQLWRVVGIA